MMGYKILVTSFFALISFQVSARENSCSKKPSQFQDVDLRNEFGEIRDQGSIGWCYSYGSADLIGHWVQKHGGGDSTTSDQMVSAAALSYRYNQDARNMELGRQAAHREIFEETSRLYQKAQEDSAAKTRKWQEATEGFMERDGLAKELANRSSDVRARMNAEYLQMKQRMAVGGGMMGMGGVPMASAGGNVPISGVGSYSNSPWSQAIDQVNLMEKQIQAGAARDPDVVNASRQLLRAKAKEQTLQTFLPQPLTEAEAGSPARVLEDARQNGFCREKDVPSIGFQGAGVTNDGPGWRMPGATRGDEISKILTEKVAPYFQKRSEANLCLAAEGLRASFPRIPLADIKSILKESVDNDQDHILNLLQKACRPEPLVGNPRVKQTTKWDEVRKLLGEKKPVGIIYHSEVLQYGDALLTSQIKRNESHFSVLVGQRFNCESGEVELILRNSWGAKACEENRKLFNRGVAVPPAMMDRMNRVNQKTQFCYEGCSRAPDRTPCQERCLKEYSAEASQAAAVFRQVQDVPYSCESGYYVIRESQLKNGFMEGVALE